MSQGILKFKKAELRMSLTLNFRIRHNLSLHVCFMRIKNVSGALETADLQRRASKKLKESQKCVGSFSFISVESYAY